MKNERTTNKNGTTGGSGSGSVTITLDRVDDRKNYAKFERVFEAGKPSATVYIPITEASGIKSVHVVVSR